MAAVRRIARGIRAILWTAAKLGNMKYTLLGLTLLAATATAQLPPPPERGPSPLLHVRFALPPGMKVTFFQGAPTGKQFAAPVTVGLRPGYIYRMQLSDHPRFPAAELFPTLEVRGTLRLPCGFRAADYPAPVTFSDEEIQHVLDGAYVTKVVYLEHPDTAAPLATRPDQPLETTLRPGDKLLEEARALGRPLLVIRLGGRQVKPEEMVRQSAAGTILFPGDKFLAPPAAPPALYAPCWQTFDPLMGPRPPEEECLKDGGDSGTRIGIDPEGNLRGLDPSDTAATYSDHRGRRRLTISNRICLCVPRFAVLRQEVLLGSYHVAVGPVDAENVQSQVQIRSQQPSLEKRQHEHLEANKGRYRPSGAESVEGPKVQARVRYLKAYDMRTGPGDVLGTAAAQKLTLEEKTRLSRQMELARDLGQQSGPRGVESANSGPRAVGQLRGVNVVASVQELRDLTVTCDDAPRLLDKAPQPLTLHKWADRESAQVGDVVTFFLKYTNQGGQPIDDVAVSDSLTGRLEYVPGSAQSSRDGVFTMQQNEAGSLILQWEISGRLLPGHSGTVRFQAKVR